MKHGDTVRVDDGVFEPGYLADSTGRVEDVTDKGVIVYLSTNEPWVSADFLIPIDRLRVVPEPRPFWEEGAEPTVHRRPGGRKER